MQSANIKMFYSITSPIILYVENAATAKLNYFVIISLTHTHLPEVYLIETLIIIEAKVRQGQQQDN